MPRYTGGGGVIGSGLLVDNGSTVTGTQVAAATTLMILNGIASGSAAPLIIKNPGTATSYPLEIWDDNQGILFRESAGSQTNGDIQRDSGGGIAVRSTGAFAAAHLVLQAGASSGNVQIVASNTGKSIEFQPSATGGVLFEPAAGGNGQNFAIKVLTELTTIAAAATTDTTIQIPANSVVLGVSVRVTTIIPTAATFDVGVAGATTRYGTGVLVAATTTNSAPTVPLLYAAAASIRITPDLTPGANTGRVRVTIHYYDLTPPTS